MRSLPFITAVFPGIGTEIKAEPAHTVVEEMPLYEPCGEGEHVYLRVTREGWTTRALHKRLATLFGLREVGVGYAGLKDKSAKSPIPVPFTAGACAGPAASRAPWSARYWKTMA